MNHGHKTLCGAVQSKFWGQTQGIFVGRISEVHYLEVNKGGYCSKHRHRDKWNRFFLIDGVLQVTIYRKAGEDVTILKAGQFTDVAPSDLHRFECLEDCKCIEIYWVDEITLNVNDIEREDVGGP
jgi:mannose-6-phosphate isomerase-like protein (cupin superfamily)